MALDNAVAVVRDGSRAAAVLHPLRLKILGALREPDSASGVARRLNLPRQRVNYHVRELARAGFLSRAGDRRRGNMVERRYVAAARSYVLSPDLLGTLGAEVTASGDSLAAGHLIALLSRAHAEVGLALQTGAETGKRFQTFSIGCDVRFETAEQRAWFEDALRRAVLDVVDRLASPAADGAGAPAPGQLHRLIVGCYAAPRKVGQSHFPGPQRRKV
ncbi:MAG: helix-turn-helix transcriptional regulator [Acidobacteria bacterium]|nr:helix-turn-helix transcriptional regulator [Acidobacteriota bacterium]